MASHPISLLAEKKPLERPADMLPLSVLLGRRQSLLDALPIAAALLTKRGDTLILDAVNGIYERLDGSDNHGSGDVVPLPLLSRSRLQGEVATFLASDEHQRDLRWADGGDVAGRHFSVRMSRLDKVADGEPRCLLTLVDRTAEVQTEQSLRTEMSTDSLTGLLNRPGFTEHIEAEIVSGTMEPSGFALLIVDLRRFGRINESVGALSGDELLITVARRLLSPLRKGDLIARTGANEFGVLLRGAAHSEAAMQVAARIRQVFDAPFRLCDLEIRVDCAIGCVAAEPGLDVDELIRRAQFATKRAKSSGDIEHYQPVAFDQARRRFTLETELRRAIEGDRLALAFQPITSLETGRLIGFEALSRWTLDDRAIPPAEFIPVAEESGLIVALGRWALDRSVRTLAKWDGLAGKPLPLSMAVNLSPLQIAGDDVPGLVSRTLHGNGVAGGRLHVELTESAIIADPDRAMNVLAALRELKVELALDDFGTGYSNLASLQRLPIDMLKIDRSFVTDMLIDRDKAAIVRAIISLGRALGLRTTAEGVESQPVVEALRDLGCTRAQGYLFSRPLSPEAAFALLSAESA